MPLLARRFSLLFTLVVVFPFCGAICAAAEDDLGSKEASAASAWAMEAFAKIDCRSAAKPATRFDAHGKSILRWSNPAVGRVYGDVFLWTRGKRPVALVSLYEWYSPHTDRTAEFLSLSEEFVTVTIDGNVRWQPNAVGLSWKLLEPSPVPAGSAPSRLAQMRAIVERFEIVLDDRRNDDRGQSQPLRRLTRPIFRYQDDKSQIIDGALFAFVAGTDPEAFLLVEARRNSKPTASWHCALARMNADALSVKLDDTVVQRFPNVRQHLLDPTKPYSITLWPRQRENRQLTVSNE